MTDDRELANVAINEARRMLATVEQTGANDTISMSASQFRTLAHLLNRVAVMRQQDPNDFDAPIDGVRFWVPLSHLERERVRFNEALAIRSLGLVADDLAF